MEGDGGDLNQLALQLVMDWLPTQDVVSVGQVCRKWREVAKDPFVWRSRQAPDMNRSPEASDRKLFWRVIKFAPFVRKMSVEQPEEFLGGQWPQFYESLGNEDTAKVLGLQDTDHSNNNNSETAMGCHDESVWESDEPESLNKLKALGQQEANNSDNSEPTVACHDQWSFELREPDSPTKYKALGQLEANNSDNSEPTVACHDQWSFELREPDSPSKYKALGQQEANNSDSSESVVAGHDEWSFESRGPDSPTKYKLKQLEVRVEYLSHQMEHLQWHNAMYRSALAAIPSGPQTFNIMREVIKEKRSKTPLCLECEKDDLISKLASYQNACPLQESQLQSPPSSSISPVFCSTKRKRRQKKTEENSEYLPL
ncbi:uncharacterized protein LOC117644956 [Thrips palmi]|uniref:Uncharacterized protein LOC117644956 n=1 Tax=Thrips palmi TaxID=161013 RepID=A0A6P8ZMI7_THRPL|nr:uncharacterized protein LOC117644956 [Thrips palmi]